MMRVELELSVPLIAETDDYGTPLADPLGIAAVISSALLEPLGVRGVVVHAVRVEEMDA